MHIIPQDIENLEEFDEDEFNAAGDLATQSLASTELDADTGTEPPTHRLANIPLDRLRVGERFREDYGDMEDFLESIRDKGVLQPITVRPLPGDGEEYELLAGGRRTVAARAVGLTVIPALIRDFQGGELDLREIELFENVFRKEMEWTERAKLVSRIQSLWSERFKSTPWKWSMRKCAKMLGVNVATVSRNIDVAKAIEEIPGLKECKTQEEALKLIKKMQEKVAVNEAVTAHIEKHRALGETLVSRANREYMIGDAFEGLDRMLSAIGKGRRLHDINLIEVDPPYGIDLQEVKRRADSTDLALAEYNEVDRADYTQFLRGLTDRLYKVASDQCWMVFWYGPSWHTEVKIELVRAGWNVDPIPAIWVKGYGQTNAPNYNLARAYEPFFVCRKGNIALSRKGRANVFSYAPVPPGSKYHPTQRPLQLMEDIIQTFGSPNTTLLCPFLGSGTTLRAAYRNHMRGIGWDLSEEYKKSFLLALEEDQQYLEKQNAEDRPDGQSPSAN